jgi:hypothetical protein
MMARMLLDNWTGITIDEAIYSGVMSASEATIHLTEVLDDEDFACH